MRTKNFLIASGVLILGIIIYKLLFGFILPIVLFVSLGSILKILLKGSEENIDKSSAEVITESSISLSHDDVVEVQLMDENKSVDLPTDESIEGITQRMVPMMKTLKEITQKIVPMMKTLK